MIARPVKIRENQTVRGKHNNISNRNKYNFAPCDPNSPSPASLGDLTNLKKQDYDLKSHVMKIIVTFKENTNNSLKQI